MKRGVVGALGYVIHKCSQKRHGNEKRLRGRGRPHNCLKSTNDKPYWIHGPPPPLKKGKKKMVPKAAV